MNRSRRFRMSVSGMMAIVANVAAILTLGTGSRTDHLSCHLCHNRKQVASRVVFFVPVSWRETMETDYPAPPEHRHVWWRYARSQFGLLTSGASSSSHRYVDGTLGPDGRP